MEPATQEKVRVAFLRSRKWYQVPAGTVHKLPASEAIILQNDDPQSIMILPDNYPRGTVDFVRCRFIDAVPGFSYKAGDIGVIPSDCVEYLLFLNKINLITEAIEEQKVQTILQEPEKVFCTWIKPAPGFAFHKGESGYIRKEVSEYLIEGGFIVLGTVASDPLPVDTPIKYTMVRWLKRHPAYSYKENEKGSISIQAAIDLQNKQYLKILPVSLFYRVLKKLNNKIRLWHTV